MARANPEVEQKTFQCVDWAYPNSQVVNNRTLDLRRRSYTGTVTPGFPDVALLPYNDHTVSLRRFIPETDFFVEGYNRTSGRLERRYSGNPAYWCSYPSIDIHLPNTEVDGSNADLKARSKVIGEVQRVKANVAQDIAEYRQVRNLFLTNTRRIANGIRALRRGDLRTAWECIPITDRHKESFLRRGPLDIRRNIPEVILEINYGIRPLMGTVHSALTEFYRRVEEGYEIRADGRSTFYSGLEPKRWTSTSGYYANREYTTTRHRVKYRIVYQVDNAKLANLDDWGITNPYLLAWELLPWSFVFDWFLPVGSWLEQVGYQLGLTFKRGFVARLSTRFTKIVAVPRTDYPTWWFKCNGTAAMETTKYRRFKLTTFPSPGRPRFDPNGLRGVRVLNALALLATALDRKPPRKL